MSPVPHQVDTKRLTREVDAALRELNQVKLEREEAEAHLAGLRRREAAMMAEVHRLCGQLAQALKG